MVEKIVGSCVKLILYNVSESISYVEIVRSNVM